MSRRPSKKSETLEVRIPHEVKHALMRKARGEGRSASEVVRASIDSYLAGQQKEARSMFITLWKPAAAIGTASIAIMWAALAPSPTHATPDLKSVFQMLDRDHDGAITFGEFVRDASDPAVEKMHQAHMNHPAVAKQMAKVHAEMMANPHAKPSEPALRKHFDELDANSDGAVTFAEFKQLHTSLMGSHGH